jgi:hypothetical protein
MLRTNDFGINSGGTGGGGGGGVQSVTGLNTNNTDPTNPIVQISVDGTTIAGAGTPASPLAITTALPVINMAVDLTDGDVDLTGAGIYRITAFGTPPNVFNFNANGIVDGSRVILTNSNSLSTSFAYVGSIGGSGILVLYQGTQELVRQIPSGMTYEFIYNSAETTWYCLNPTPQICPAKIDLDAWGGTYFILTSGFFTFYNNATGYEISLPQPTAFNGLQLIIWNQDATSVLGFSSGGGAPQPVRPSGTAYTSIGTENIVILTSMAGEWVVTNS